MLVELKRSPLAEELTGVNAAIVALLHGIATSDDYEEAMATWPYSSRPPRKRVEAVLELPADERHKLLDAVQADMSFETNGGGGSFTFAFFELDTETRAAGKELLVSMYNDVFRRAGFLLTGGEHLNRATWEEAFREANPGLRVCPACLSAFLEFRIEGRAAVDVDHYLPKNIYPALSVHRFNLVPLCKACNSIAKHKKDPLLSPEGDRLHLSRIWFPYRNPGLDEVQLVFEPSNPVPRLARFDGDVDAVERATNFDALFGLAAKWSKHLEGIHASTCNYLRELGTEPEPAAVRHHLLTLARIKEADRINMPDAYLSSCYLRWLSTNPRALMTLTKSLQSTHADQ